MKLKKGLKTVIILATALILLFATACFEQPRDVSGQYETIFSFGRYLAEGQVQDFEENGLGFVQNLKGRYELILSADGTFELSFDSEQFKEDVFAALNENKDAIFERAMERNGVEEKEYEVFAKRSGYDGVNDLKDSIIAKMEEEITQSAGFQNLEQKSAHGTYTVKKDIITFQTGENSLQYDHASIYENGDLYIASFFGQNISAEFKQY